MACFGQTREGKTHQHHRSAFSDIRGKLGQMARDNFEAMLLRLQVLHGSKILALIAVGVTLVLALCGLSSLTTFFFPLFLELMQQFDRQLRLFGK